MPRKPGDTRTVHPQTEVNDISVDQGIAPLLVQLWRRGFITNQSCQGGNGQAAYIQFVRLGMAQQFIAQTVDRLMTHTALTPDDIQRWRLRLTVVAIPGRLVGGLVTVNPEIVDNLVELWEI